MIDQDGLVAGLGRLGVPTGAVLMVHASLSAFGQVAGGADTVLDALLTAVGPTGTVVVPAFIGQVRDPCPGADPLDPAVIQARVGVALFDDRTPTAMGALPSAVLARPDRLRSWHPQASVAAIGAAARQITEVQPLAYALGADSPFGALYRLRAQILLLGVGHNRNSFLHHAETLVAGHRRKLRRFPYLVERHRVWVEVPDVGDDNDTHFPRVGAEFAEQAAGQGIRRANIGQADCQLIDSVPFIDFARRRLAELLAG
jgi:aminoglycoside 3-N-acetyltransferase